MAITYIDPIKNIISFLLSSDADQTKNGTVLFNIDDVKDIVEVGSTSKYRIFPTSLKIWDLFSSTCKAITINKSRIGFEGKSAIEQSVEMGLEVICWGNKGTEASLMELWGKVDNFFHNKHDVVYGTDFETGMTAVHSFRSQEPVFDTRFALNSSPATTRLSSRTKLRLPSVAAVYTMLIWEQVSS